MTKNRSTYTLDMNFPRLGGRRSKQLRQKQRVSSDREFKELKQALRALYKKEMDAVIAAFYDNQISAQDVITTHQTGIVNQDFLFADAEAYSELFRWATSTHYCPENRRIHKSLMRQLKPELMNRHIRDLPHILRALRPRSLERKSSFNKFRKICLSYIKHHSFERTNSPLYQQARNVDCFNPREHKKRSGQPFKVNELDHLLREHKIADDVASWIWWLCLHGLRPKELFEDGVETRNDDGIEVLHVKGEKTVTSDRTIPLFMKIPKQPITRVRLRRALKKMGRCPYDCRRTFAVWMQTARIDRNAFKRWMGHSTISDTTDIYTQQRDITWIRDWAPVFQQWVSSKRSMDALDQDNQVFRAFTSPDDIGANRQFASMEEIKERINDVLWNWRFGDDQWCRQLYQVSHLEFVEVAVSDE